MGYDDTGETFCSKLRKLRRARGLTVDNLAEKMGENSQKVGRVERGARSLTLDYLIKASKALETPLESFFESETAERREQSKSPSETLNEIILLVEEFHQKCPLEAKKKAVIISTMYHLVQKFPEESRGLFLHSLIEFLDCLERHH
jgi:transcriptional regulator with XRE-family HTH domain